LSLVAADTNFSEAGLAIYSQQIRKDPATTICSCSCIHLLAATRASTGTATASNFIGMGEQRFNNTLVMAVLDIGKFDLR
jgi:hypothetical protein